MVAFKIYSARRIDVRDIVMMRENLDLGKVLMHLRKGVEGTLRAQVNSITEMLNIKN
jgi:hypothetical protein